MSTVQSQNLTTSYFAQKVSSRRKKMSKFNGSMIISKISARKVKRRRRKRGRNAEKENVGKRQKIRKRRRRSQSPARNHNAVCLVVSTKEE